MKTNQNNKVTRSGLPDQMQGGSALTSVLLLLNLAALCLLCYIAIQTLRRPLQFDDAFMFHR